MTSNTHTTNWHPIPQELYRNASTLAVSRSERNKHSRCLYSGNTVDHHFSGALGELCAAHHFQSVQGLTGIDEHFKDPKKEYKFPDLAYAGIGLEVKAQLGRNWPRWGGTIPVEQVTRSVKEKKWSYAVWVVVNLDIDDHPLYCIRGFSGITEIAASPKEISTFGGGRQVPNYHCSTFHPITQLCDILRKHKANQINN